MAKKSNYYTVWNGVKPGVYDNWNTCKQQISGYDGALYKSFPTKELAEAAFNDQPWNHIGKKAASVSKQQVNYNNNPAILKRSLAVDAACSGNPGDMEYRGVHIETGEEIFKQGPFKMGTNNIGEFLAIVHALALLKQTNNNMPIYSDSANAISWIKQKKCKTKLQPISINLVIFDMIARAEKWLANNTYSNKIIKWETKEWGEIPADFGRK